MHLPCTSSSVSFFPFSHLLLSPPFFSFFFFSSFMCPYRGMERWLRWERWAQTNRGPRGMNFWTERDETWERCGEGVDRLPKCPTKKTSSDMWRVTLGFLRGLLRSACSACDKVAFNTATTTASNRTAMAFFIAVACHDTMRRHYCGRYATPLLWPLHTRLTTKRGTGILFPLPKLCNSPVLSWTVVSPLIT